MLTSKKIMAVLCLLGSYSIYAGTTGPVCTPGVVAAPCGSSTWDFGARALYLNQTYNNRSFDGSIVSGNNQTWQNITDNWGWGFMVEGSYHFNAGRDFNLNWYHLDKKNTKATPDGLISLIGQHLGESNDVDNLIPRWDAVNFEYGQYIDISDKTLLRLHGGAEYAHINVTETTTDVGTVVGDTTYLQRVRKYNGFGPRIGVDLAANLGNGFGAYVKGAAALLVGSSRLNVKWGYYGLESQTLNASATAMSSMLEAKLGAAYNHALAQGNLIFDAGWMWINYTNVNLYIATPSSVSSSDFGLQGPYVGLKWLGNIA